MAQAGCRSVAIGAGGVAEVVWGADVATTSGKPRVAYATAVAQDKPVAIAIGGITELAGSPGVALVASAGTVGQGCAMIVAGEGA